MVLCDLLMYIYKAASSEFRYEEIRKLVHHITSKGSVFYLFPQLKGHNCVVFCMQNQNRT